MNNNKVKRVFKNNLLVTASIVSILSVASNAVLALTTVDVGDPETREEVLSDIGLEVEIPSPQVPDDCLIKVVGGSPILPQHDAAGLITFNVPSIREHSLRRITLSSEDNSSLGSADGFLQAVNFAFPPKQKDLPTPEFVSVVPHFVDSLYITGVGRFEPRNQLNVRESIIIAPESTLVLSNLLPVPAGDVLKLPPLNTNKFFPSFVEINDLAVEFNGHTNDFRTQVKGEVALHGHASGTIEAIGNNTTLTLGKNFTFKGNIEDSRPAADQAAWLRIIASDNVNVSGDIAWYSGAVILEIPEGATFHLGGNIGRGIVGFNKGSTLRLYGTFPSFASHVSVIGEDATIDASKVSTLVFYESVGGTQPLGKLLWNKEGEAITFKSNVKINTLDFNYSDGRMLISEATNQPSHVTIKKLLNAKEATFFIAEDVELSDSDLEFKKVKLSDGKTWSIKNSRVIAQSFMPCRDSTNDIILEGGGYVFMKGDFGSPDNRFKDLIVGPSHRNILDDPLSDEVKVISGKAYFKTTVLEGAKSGSFGGAVLGISDDFHTDYFMSGADTVLMCENTKPMRIVTSQEAVGSSTLLLMGNDVELIGKGFVPSKVIFRDAYDNSPDSCVINVNLSPTLVLSSGQELDDIDINNITTSKEPIIRVSGAHHTISPTQRITSDPSRPLKITLLDDSVMDVKAPRSFVAAIKPEVDGIGAVFFTKDDNDFQRPSEVYGLGSLGKRIKEIYVANNTVNFGDTYAQTVDISLGQKFTTGSTGEGLFRLSNHSKVVFRDGAVLRADIESNGGKEKNVIFEGNNTVIGKIGEPARPFIGRVEFNVGGKDFSTTLKEDVYASELDFHEGQVVVEKSVLNLRGLTSFNGNIELGSNKLVLEDGLGTVWGSTTSINTTLNSQGELGNIEVRMPLNTCGTIPVIINNEKDVGGSDEEEIEYTFFTSKLNDGGNGEMSDISFDLQVLQPQAYVEWSQRRYNDQVKLIRKVTKPQVEELVAQPVDGSSNIDLTSIASNDAGSTDIANASASLESGNTEDAMAFDDTNKVPVQDKVEGIVKATNPSVSEIGPIVECATSQVISSLINNRMLLISQPPMQPAAVAPSAGGDDPQPIGADQPARGAWVMPFYSHAIQKGKATKNGDKARANTFLFSLYGTQNLNEQLFVGGLGFYANTKINDKELRKFSFGEQIAVSKYDSKSYGGALFMGYKAMLNDVVLLTPLAGVRYIKVNNDSYQETGTTFANSSVAASKSSRFDGMLGAKMSTSVKMSDNNTVVVPEVHAMIYHKFGGKAAEYVSSLDGQARPFKKESEKVKMTYNLGASTTFKFNNSFEYGLGYDAHLAKKYVAHQGSLKLRLNF